MQVYQWITNSTWQPLDSRLMEQELMISSVSPLTTMVLGMSESTIEAQQGSKEGSALIGFFQQCLFFVC